MDIEGWLRSVALERYEAAFRDNEIDRLRAAVVTIGIGAGGSATLLSWLHLHTSFSQILECTRVVH